MTGDGPPALPTFPVLRAVARACGLIWQHRARVLGLAVAWLVLYAIAWAIASGPQLSAAEITPGMVFAALIVLWADCMLAFAWIRGVLLNDWPRSTLSILFDPRLALWFLAVLWLLVVSLLVGFLAGGVALEALVGTIGLAAGRLGDSAWVEALRRAAEDPASLFALVVAGALTLRVFPALVAMAAGAPPDPLRAWLATRGHGTIMALGAALLMLPGQLILWLRTGVTPIDFPLMLLANLLVTLALAGYVALAWYAFLGRGDMDRASGRETP